MILILGDSLAVPRPNDGIHIQDTYAHKLSTYDSVINRAQEKTSTFKQLKRIKSDVAGIKPDIVIIQLGIVDCSPRLFTYRQHQFLSFLNIFLPNLISKYTDNKSKKRYEFTQKNKIVYTTPEQFRINIKKILDIILKDICPKKIFLVNICYPSQLLKEKNYDIEKNILNYNKILNEFKDELISLIDMFTFTKHNPDALLNDEHMSAKGHDYVSNIVIKWINDSK